MASSPVLCVCHIRGNLRALAVFVGRHVKVIASARSLSPRNLGGRNLAVRFATVVSAAWWPNGHQPVQVISTVLDQCNGDLNEALEKLTELSLTSNSSEQCGVAHILPASFLQATRPCNLMSAPPCFACRNKQKHLRCAARRVSAPTHDRVTHTFVPALQCLHSSVQQRTIALPPYGTRLDNLVAAA